MIFIKLNFLFILFISIKASTPLNIEDDLNILNTTNFTCSSIESNLKLGDTIILCIHIPEINKKIAYKIKVDEYSVLNIKNGYTQSILNIKDKDDYVHFLAQIGEIKSNYPSVNLLFLNYYSYI